jgi:type IV secretion system protein TrbL
VFRKLCKSPRRTGGRWLPLVALASIYAQFAFAQNNGPFQTHTANDILQQFKDQRVLWTTNIWVYANTLFGILAVIEFAWSAAVMLLEKTDLQSWTSALIRKLMWIGAFYALLINGRIWIPAIIDSFSQIGATAAGMVGPLSPGDVFVQGLNIAGALIDAGSTSAFFTNPGTSFALVLCALLIVGSYIIITLNFIVTMVESYLVVSVGFIFLGFGGSRWTVPYTERYIGLAISIGIKIVLLYCLITAGMNLGIVWIDEAQTVGTAPHPNMVAFDVMGAALIFMMCCWQIPKLFAAVPGGRSCTCRGRSVGDGDGRGRGWSCGSIAWDRRGCRHSGRWLRARGNGLSDNCREFQFWCRRFRCRCEFRRIDGRTRRWLCAASNKSSARPQYKRRRSATAARSAGQAGAN